MSHLDRRRRAVHKLAISAAALAVCILPTACDYPVASPAGAPTGTDSATTAPIVVPVGNTVDARRSGDRDQDRRTGTRTTRPTSTTTTAPAAGTGTTTTSATASNGTTVADGSVDPSAGATTTAAATTTSAPPAGNNGLDVLGRTCADGANANLAAHTGFQSGDAQCVSTQMGAVAAEKQLPSLLITKAPRRVGVNRPFVLQVSTRNLVRDRFLGAAAGGYYLESSFLNGAGLQRGHFHTACRILQNARQAPDSAPAPEFFLATQDNGGGAAPDTVSINVPGIKKAGTLQCSSWAGDGSHRTPMMSRANQTPAFDSVRILVAGNGPAVEDDAADATPAATAAATADATADAQEQADAEQAAAGAQRPDQDGAPQPVNAPAPATTESAAPAAGGQASLQERFREVQGQQGQGN